MAKPKRYTERVLARFREGTMARIKALLIEKDEKEAVTDLIREAVEREIQRRERGTARKAKH